MLDELGIGLVAYAPLARGFLTGAVKPAGEYDTRHPDPGVYPWCRPGNFEKNLYAANQLSELANAQGVSTSQLALAWLLAQGEHIVPVPGSGNPRARETIAAVALRLTEVDLRGSGRFCPTVHMAPASMRSTPPPGSEHHA
ncbi:aldo/keto reductase [Streptomyces sp. NPDC001414]